VFCRVFSSCPLRLVNIRVGSCCVWKSRSVRIDSIFVHNFFTEYNYFLIKKENKMFAENYFNIYIDIREF